MNQFARMARNKHAVDKPGRPKRAPQTPQHRTLQAKVQLARKELGLADDDYRAILLRVTRKTSSSDCSVSALAAVIEEFKAKGWKQAQPAGKGRPRPADHPGAGKARAMWISLHHLGAIDNPSEQALEAFAKRQLGCERLQWANQSHIFSLIEALKGMAQRHGWNQDLAGLKPDATVIVLKRRLVEAILGKLWQAGLIPATWDANRAAYELTGEDIDLLFASASHLDMVARAMGERLRDADRAAQVVL